MNWKEYKFSDFVDINPKVALKKGVEYSFVEMKDLSEGNKFVLPSQKRELKGGSRFEDNDTLFARITPCLENGKISQVKGLENGVGFGSTEFLVFRGKKGVSNTDFVHYLSLSDEVRRFAEQNMVGTSGRQRVSWQAFENLELSLPDLPTQTAIAEILSSLDDKIELNNKINQELENLAQTLFKQWFIDFEFPNENGEPYKSSGGEMVESELGEIPKGWQVKPLYDYANYVNGAAYKNMYFNDEPDSLPVIKIVELKNGISEKTAFTNTNLGEKYRISNGDILFSWSGSPETSIDVFIWACGEAWLNQHIFKIVTLDEIERSFVYSMLKFWKPKFIAIAKDKQTTGLGHVTIRDLKEQLQPVSPNNLLATYADFSIPIIDSIQSNLEEINELMSLRDTLLPKLISGELEVADIMAEKA